MEDVHKSGIVLDREFLQMELCGALAQANGFVIGEFQDTKKELKVTIDDVIQKYFQNGKPCTYGYPFSHGPVVAPIPIGAVCDVDADACQISFDFRMDWYNPKKDCSV